MSSEDTIQALAGLGKTGEPAEAVAGRSHIFQMTAKAEQAVLRPKDFGRWPHPLRAALAARIAALNGADDLARHYAEAAGDFDALADPGEDGTTHGLGPVIAHIDKVAIRTSDVDAADITALQEVGISDADIVRLCELNAFLSYQLRVIAGLRLMTGDSA
jgi:uncharacterized protein YciW